MKLKGWIDDKEWADQFWPEVARVIREVAGDIIGIRVADSDEDQRCATDYVVIVASGDIGCRIRKWYYWERFGDLTFRNSRPSGQMTEVEKIKNGYGRWYLYGWIKEDSRLGAWVFLDLDLLRASGLLNSQGEVWTNKDGSSDFIALSLAQVSEAGCVVATGGAASHA